SGCVPCGAAARNAGERRPPSLARASVSGGSARPKGTAGAAGAGGADAAPGAAAGDGGDSGAAAASATLGRARSLSVLGADGGSIARSPAPSLPATTALESLAPS